MNIEINMSDQEILEATSPERITEIETQIATEIENRASGHHMNRAQRRAFERKLGRKGRQNRDIITETARKIDYIDLIQRLRELNKKKENEKDEATKD